MTLHKLYQQLRSTAQRNPLSRVRDFKLVYRESGDGVRIFIKYTSHYSLARDMASLVLAFYGGTGTGELSYRTHFMPDFENPIQKIYGWQPIEA